MNGTGNIKWYKKKQIFSYHADLHVSDRMKTITVCPNNDNVTQRILSTADPWPSPAPAAQLDDIQPQEDDVQVGQLWLQEVNLTMSPHLDFSGTVKLLSQVEDNKC